MKKRYYFYNPQTLSYERIYLSWKQRIWVVFRHLFTGIIIGVGIFLFSIYCFTSPRELQLKKENILLKTQYDVLSRRMNEASLVLKDLQQRDDKLYRVIYQTEPIPASVRESGFGGINRYEALMNMPNAELLVSTTKKMDILSKQLYVQNNSYDEIFNLVKSQEDRLKCIPGIQPVANKDLMHVSSGFGTRMDPVYNIRKFHEGMDFKAETGTDIYATGNGKVTFSGWRQGYGNCIIIDHGYGYETLYGHCYALFAQEGKNVVRGEVIAAVGSTGKSTGPHLHYEVRVRGIPDNPAKYYFMDLSPEEYDKMFEIAANHGQVMD
ncbi:MAG: M23 family metallopeptidase [Dysgonamonadaceae bacterium]|jgi:murein DD-endopeptidase MepM/ murein hydrolase activator NlpD|nr:M23 family metallopeptidase [Dysgonamonadaceae bacterium]